MRRVVLLRALAVRLLIRGGRRGAVEGAVLDARREARRVVMLVRQGPDAHLRRFGPAAGAGAGARDGAGARARVVMVVRVRHLLLERRRVRRLRLLDLHEAVVLVRLQRRMTDEILTHWTIKGIRQIRNKFACERDGYLKNWKLSKNNEK